MSTNNWNDLGDEFKKTMNEALVNGDFRNINKLVNDTVNCAINEARNKTLTAVSDISDELSKSFTAEKKGKRVSVTVSNDSYTFAKPDKKKKKTKELLNCKVNEVGKVSGVLFNTFGGIGLGITIITTLGMFFAELASSTLSLTSFIGNAIFLLVFSLMIKHGNKNLQRVNRAKRYAMLGKESQYVTIDNLVSHLGMKRKKVIADIHKMLELGMYPEGHFDEQETCLIFTNEMYKTYQQMQRAKRELDIQQANEKKQLEEQYKDIEHNPELQEMIQEGNECIKKLRDLNDEIEGEVFSDKLYRLENVLKEIFAQIKIHPEKMSEMHKVMSYYLPTTLKMVEAYSEFDDISEPGTDIIEAKKQIEGAIDNINDAFNQLMNKLFLDKVYDVTTDAQVLQSILSREGLLKNDMEAEREKVTLDL